MQQIQDEIIIIGGGLAGIVASLELITQGKRVTLLDRDLVENLGGQAKESFGGLFVVDSLEQRRSGFRDTPEQAWQDWLSFGEFHDQDDWPRRWAETYVHTCRDEVYLWLKQLGLRFLPLPSWVERGQLRTGNSLPRFHILWGTGHYLIQRLLMHLHRQNPSRKPLLTVKSGYRVESLLTEGGRVTGCRGHHEQDATPFEARADAVIVATGGINGDLERVRRHWHVDWGTPPALLLNGSHRHADGLLHDAVFAIGGRLTNLERMWNYAAGVHHWMPRKPLHGLSLVPPRSALWLNWRGERFEHPPLVTGFDTRDLVTRICHEERAYSWQVLNRRIALRELAISGAEFNPSIRERRILGFLRDMLLGNRRVVDDLIRHCEDVVVADTLPELADKMNALQQDQAIDRDKLSATIRAYDGRIAAGDMQDEQLQRIACARQWRGDRMRISNNPLIDDPQARPLIAIREFIISRKSLGGIQTDLDCRVLDQAGAPIPGLYAIGEAAGFGGGGMNGLRALEGTFLGGCILTGRRVARALTR